VLLFEGLATVQKKDSAGRLAGRVEGNGQKRVNLKFLQDRAGKARQVLNGPAVATVPAKAWARADHRVPTEGCVHVVQEKAVRAGKRQAFRDEAVIFARLHTPE